MLDPYIYIVDDLLFFCAALLLVYLFVFAVVSHFKRANYATTKKIYSCVFLVPESSVLPTLYKDEPYEFIIYKDLMQAVQQLDKEQYQMVILLSDKACALSPQLLKRICNAYDAGMQAIQLHTVISNSKGVQIRFRTIWDEISNSLFRSGNNQLGFSSASQGTNIAFELEWLQSNMKSNKTNLERKLFIQNIYIEYLPDAKVYCESVPSYPYRKRLKKELSYFLPSILEGNWNFCNRIVQQLLPSPLKSLIIIAIWTLLLTGYDWTSSLKWWFILFGLAITYSLAIPDYLVEKKKKHLILWRKAH